MQNITIAALLIIYLQTCSGFNDRFTAYHNNFRLSCISSDDQLPISLSSDNQSSIENDDTIEIPPSLDRVEEVEEVFANPDQIQNEREVLPYSPGIYVLELENNGIYVGKSNQNVEARVKEHFNSGGSAFTKRFKPLSQSLTLTPATTDLESYERAETLEQMWVNGISNVRGWQYTKIDLTEFEYESIFRQMCERKDLCRFLQTFM
jgi:predicted GIY-YIG superfamily endonuclease